MMKIKSTGWILFIFLLGCSGQSGFNDYRANPFQYPYPEYYFKADTIPIEHRSEGGGHPDHMDIEAFGVAFSIEKRNADSINLLNHAYYAKKSGRLRFVVLPGKEEMMGCNERVRELEKDFCSAFESTKAYYQKLFLLTPENLSEKKYLAAGNRWIVHHKGRLFKNVEDISIYQSKDLSAFRTDFKPSANRPTSVELKIFHKKTMPDFVTIGLVDRDEDLIRQILSTIH